MFRSYNVASFGHRLLESTPRSRSWGEVIAVFRRSCYVQGAEGELICIASQLVDDGPLTMRVKLPFPYDMNELGVRLGMAVGNEDDDWWLGEEVSLRMSGAKPWAPAFVTDFAPPATVLRRIQLLAYQLQGPAPDAGLALLIRHVGDLARGRSISMGVESRTAQIASQRVARLTMGVWTRDYDEIDAAVRGLIGFGPGLTPSGDDLLGGFTIGLIAVLDPGRHLSRRHDAGLGVAQGRRDVVGALARSVLRCAAAETTKISAALLSHATEGVGTATVHRLVRAILRRKDDPELANVACDLTKVGHTSGWDSLVGILLGVHVGVRLESEQPGNDSGGGTDAETRAVYAHMNQP